MKIIIILILLTSLNLFSQEKIEPLKVQKSDSELSSIENIRKSEKIYD
jgi:hypothetical protein